MALMHASGYAFITDAQFEILLANGLRAIEQEDSIRCPLSSSSRPMRAPLGCSRPSNRTITMSRMACATSAWGIRRSVPCD